METEIQGNSLGEMQMVPVGVNGAPETVDLATSDVTWTDEPVKKKAGRPKKTKADAVEQGFDVPLISPNPQSGEGDGYAATLGVFALNAGASLPEFATAGAGAFDIRANLHGVSEITVYTGSNKKTTTAVRDQYGVLSVILLPGARAMVPTGLIFDIPDGYKLEFSARSGLALKEGLNLANGQALIDADYVEESFVLIHNTSELRTEIKHGDRIAQAALAKVVPTQIIEITARPAQKTERDGGMGSTGVQ